MKMNRRDALKGIAALTVGLLAAPAVSLKTLAPPSSGPVSISYSIGVDLAEGFTDTTVLVERIICRQLALPAELLDRGGTIPTVYVSRVAQWLEEEEVKKFVARRKK